MRTLAILCACGERFNYKIDPASVESELGERGIAPILVSHGDHFVTLYVDRNYSVRSVEKVLLATGRTETVHAPAGGGMSPPEIKEKISQLMKDIDPEKNHIAFFSRVASIFHTSDELFAAGRYTGYELWIRKRQTLLKLGAHFKLDPELVISNELKPIFDKLGKTKYLKGEKTLAIQEVISPQFFLGIAQGILDAIHAHVENRDMVIEIEHNILENTLFLRLKQK